MKIKHSRGSASIEYVICAGLLAVLLFAPFGENNQSAVDALMSAIQERYEAQSYAISHPVVGSPHSLSKK